ncbi:MAG: hypothetical protein ACRDHM_10770 [Actinomycetota bacterium]
MTRSVIVVLGLIAATAGGVAAVAGAGDEPLPPVGGPTNQEMASQGVLWHGKDLGEGERILLVIGGSFPTAASAEQANETITFGDLQGYYVARTDQFDGLRDFMGEAADEYVLVTAFRTQTGANEFLELAEAAEAPALLTPRLGNKGPEYVGLGQEAHPDGSGPLIGPLPGVST